MIIKKLLKNNIFILIYFIRMGLCVSSFFLLIACEAKDKEVGLRQIGDSLDGGWYSDLDNGCFSDTVVIFFKYNKRWYHSEGRKVLTAKNITIKNTDAGLLYKSDQPFFHDEHKVSYKITILYEDQGEKLIPLKFFRDGRRKTIPDELKKSITLTRCSSPTPLGKINSWLGLRTDYIQGRHIPLYNKN